MCRLFVGFFICLFVWLVCLVGVFFVCFWWGFFWGMTCFSLYRPYLEFPVALCRAPVCVVVPSLKLTFALNAGLCLALDFMMTLKIENFLKWSEFQAMKSNDGIFTVMSWDMLGRFPWCNPLWNCHYWRCISEQTLTLQFCSPPDGKKSRASVWHLRTRFTGIYVAKGADRHLPWCLGGVRHLTPELSGTIQT